MLMRKTRVNLRTEFQKFKRYLWVAFVGIPFFLVPRGCGIWLNIAFLGTPEQCVRLLKTKCNRDVHAVRNI